MRQDNFIDHVNHPTALLIRALLEREQRRQLEQIIIDDEENILQALSAGVKLKMLITTDKDALSQKLREVLPSDVPMVVLSRRTGKKLFGGEKVSRNFAIATIPQPFPLELLLSCKKDLVILDHLSISGNIGAIIRTSAALNIGAMVLLGGEHMDIYDRRIIRASRGLIFKLPVLSVTSNTLIHFCNKNNIKLVVMSVYGDHLVEEVMKEQGRIAIVLGSEKEGCSQDVFDAAHFKTKILLQPIVESLNVSVAAGIVIYLRELYRRLL